MKKRLSETLEKFSKKSPTLSLCTASQSGQPQCSLIYFSVDADSNIIFFSREKTQKCKNIAGNPNVSLMAYDEAEETTLQMEGKAERIEGEEERNKAFGLMLKTLSRKKMNWPPPVGKIFGGDLSLYKVTISWARLGHFKDHENDLFTLLLPPVV